jgi:hypothetical protein
LIKSSRVGLDGQRNRLATTKDQQKTQTNQQENEKTEVPAAPSHAP